MLSLQILDAREQVTIISAKQAEQMSSLEEAFAVVSDALEGRSRRIYLNDLRVFVTWILGNERELNRRTMAAYRKYLSEKYQMTTAKRMWSVVNRTLQEMVYAGALDKHPAEGIRGFTADGNVHKHIALTLEETEQLFSVIPTDSLKGKRDLAILKILLYTGLRRSECAKLTMQRLDKVQGHWVFLLGAKDSKNKESAVVKIPQVAMEPLQNYLQAIQHEDALPEEPLFVSFKRGDKPTYKAISDQVIYRVVIEYAEKANIKRLLPHGMRASFITLSLEGGSPLDVTAHAARHKDVRMTIHYKKRRLNLDYDAVDYIGKKKDV